MTSKITYSVAHPEVCNVQDVYALCTRACLAVSEDYSEVDLLDQVDSLFYSEDYSKKILLLALVDGVPVGCLGGVRIPTHFLYGDRLVMEQVLWVDEEYRNTRAASRLIKAYERWAKEIGATHIMLSDIHGDEKLQRVYKKKGYSLMETSFVKELN